MIKMLETTYTIKANYSEILAIRFALEMGIEADKNNELTPGNRKVLEDFIKQIREIA